MEEKIEYGFGEGIDLMIQDQRTRHQRRLEDLAMDNEQRMQDIYEKRDRHLRHAEDQSENASQKFQNLVDAMLEDGHIDKSEAVALIQYHNKLQSASREALRRLLEEHGHGYNGPGPTIRRASMTTPYPKREPPPRPEPNVGNAYRSLPKPQTTTDIGVVDYGKLIPKGQKTRFFFIVAPFAILALLKLLGVI